MNSWVQARRVLQLFLLLAGFSASAQAAVVNVLGNLTWQDTGVDIVAGDLLTITATGSIVHDPINNLSSDPDGIGFFFQDGVAEPLDGTFTGFSLGGGFLLDSTIVVSLIGRIGVTPVADGGTEKGAGFVGSNYSQVAPVSGRLFLAYNDDIHNDNSGLFVANVTTSAVPVPAAIWLFGSGLLGLFGLRGWQRR